MDHFLDIVRLVLCAFNFGAICFVQVVHYPLFDKVGDSSFQRYHQLHVLRTTFLLGTTLSLEMLLNIGTFFLHPFSWHRSLPLIFLVIGWAVTFFMSVPQHNKLERGFSEKAHRTLLISNWIRVLCWGGALTAIFELSVN